MKTRFKEGKIIAEGKYFETARYELGNEKIGVTADGCGGLSSYRVTNEAASRLLSILSLDLAVNGERLSPYLPKIVEMIGRMQKITVKTPAGDLTITTFLTKDVNGVFFLVEGKRLAIDLALNCRDAKCESREGTDCVRGANFLLSSSVCGDWVRENDTFYASAKDKIKLLFSFSSDEKAHKEAFLAFDKAHAAALKEISNVRIPSSARSEQAKAMYLSAYFTAIQNYKTCGDFKAFAAGVRYVDPLRTYYRDSYFTVLPLLSSRPDLVRNEILTLARGIAADGACPSAVKSDFTSFWGDHFDSPCFFVAEISDYLRATEDEAILDEKIGDSTVLGLVERVLTRLEKRTDETGLLVKGDYDKRDWADEVNRVGYVTYVEALYYRALVLASRLFAGRNAALSDKYAAQAKKVKDAINALLFDEEKGYYVNYRVADGSAVEDNLSLDTIFTVLFGVADEDRARRVLDAAERLLETKNNTEQGGGDFGVMSVYPPYKLPRAASHKSARMYDYHNGANWCYLTAMYAYAKSLYGRDWQTPLLTTYRYMTSNGHYTPIEYFSPCCPAGSPLQGWSAALAFVWERAGKGNFFA